MFSIKTEAEIELMRKSGKILAETLALIEKEIKPGISTYELNKIAHNYIKSRGATPSCLNYEGYPASICTSVDDAVVHGIPSRNQILRDGQIVGVDICVTYRGYVTDAARTFIVGDASQEVIDLVKTTEECFFRAIEGLKDGSRVGDIGYRVQSLAESRGYSVVRDLTGHGVGRSLHEDPSIPNYGRMGLGAKLVAGMTVAIEPMINLGGSRVVFNGMWDIKTADGKPSAHYENTVLITADGVEILTI